MAMQFREVLFQIRMVWSSEAESWLEGKDDQRYNWGEVVTRTIQGISW